MFDESYRFVDYGSYKAHAFQCMGGLCEVIVESPDTPISLQVFQAVYGEAKRLEAKYSRYRQDNIVFQINNAGGSSVSIDSETYRLLLFADSLFSASGGLFDITSGVLRKVWTFNQGAQQPDASAVRSALERVGWKKVTYDKNFVQIPKNAELDFGGIGKEYAVDSACEKAKALGLAPTLVNFGGDIAVTGPKRDKSPWKIDVDQSEEKILLFTGGVATSGDKNKFVIVGGKKLGHILNPKTGWPVEGAPRSVTVVGNSCTEAGSLATLAILKGAGAEQFLGDEADQFKIIR